MIEDKNDFLKELMVLCNICSLTREFTDKEKEDFSLMLIRKHFQAKKVIFFEESSESKMYFVKSGSVIVSKKIRGAIEDVLARFGEGDFFGELSLVDDFARSASVQTETEAVLYVLEKEKLSEMEKRYPMVASKFYRALLIEMVKRLRNTTEKLQSAIIWGMDALSLMEQDIQE
ncbi:MAG: cyclic nucleotide-binding domain-containing protein [Chlamydiota bacterium]|nr:cyclic nucleotide-binding domain-containing protein [Chlamydiota bacterium]